MVTVAGSAVEIYGFLALTAASMPANPIDPLPIPFKGIAYQTVSPSSYSWVGDPTITYATVQAFMAAHVAYGAQGMRLMVGLDAGMNFNGSSQFVSFTSTFYRNIGWVGSLAAQYGISLILVVFTALGFTTGANLNRAVMTDSGILASYQTAATVFALFCNNYPAIVAFDLSNEAHYFMATNTDGSGYYTNDQINNALTSFSVGLRAGGGGQLLTLSASDGPSVPDAFGGCPASIYDIADYHSYGALCRAYQPQTEKPIICGEMGPNVSVGTDNAQIADGAVPVMFQSVGAVSAAFAWFNYLENSPLWQVEFKGL